MVKQLSRLCSASGVTQCFFLPCLLFVPCLCLCVWFGCGFLLITAHSPHLSSLLSCPQSFHHLYSISTPAFRPFISRLLLRPCGSLLFLAAQRSGFCVRPVLIFAPQFPLVNCAGVYTWANRLHFTLSVLRTTRLFSAVCRPAMRFLMCQSLWMWKSQNIDHFVNGVARLLLSHSPHFSALEESTCRGFKRDSFPVSTITCLNTKAVMNMCGADKYKHWLLQ